MYSTCLQAARYILEECQLSRIFICGKQAGAACTSPNLLNSVSNVPRVMNRRLNHSHVRKWICFEKPRNYSDCTTSITFYYGRKQTMQKSWTGCMKTNCKFFSAFGLHTLCRIGCQVSEKTPKCGLPRVLFPCFRID